ncbi:hypothetical protein T440DRAFT_138365 [Plenodomus tracheiphilus IPT5]|uniref:Uncharacterized protein n=1 Tax=Plenodomus tracheiphilus IPT5 TaxID=1408161 RepID=A0A6A7B1H1_9PLEO|nr:hypothetical protein T440DRAFT_138365 [Plenodomus tracheiphilus IPT5]
MLIQQLTKRRRRFSNASAFRQRHTTNSLLLFYLVFLLPLKTIIPSPGISKSERDRDLSIGDLACSFDISQISHFVVLNELGKLCFELELWERRCCRS